MPSFISPSGNPEVWREKPDGYLTTEEWEELHPEPLPSSDELAALLRTKRDALITSCDWIVQRHEEELIRCLDTSIDIDTYEAWLDYRQALRQLPEQEGFPWDGGGDETPWPEEPEA